MIFLRIDEISKFISHFSFLIIIKIPDKPLLPAAKP